MKNSSTFIKILKIVCFIGEIFACIGLLAMLASISFSESMVDIRRANIGLFVVNGSPDWSFYARLPRSNHGSISYSGRTISMTGESPIPDSELGAVSVGPLRMDVGEDAHRAISDDLKAQAIVIRPIEGTVTFKRSENAAQILASIKWPFIISMLCAGFAGLAILDLLRRMFKSAERGEIFSSVNIRNVRTIGLLLIASSILKFITVGWLVSRMTTYVIQHVQGEITFASAYEGNLSGLGTGFVILALAEVFRQGLKLREDAQFTV